MTEKTKVKRGPLQMKVGEETFSLNSPTLGSMMNLISFQERIVSGDVDMQSLSGFEEFAKFLVVLFNNEKLTYDKILKVEILDIYATLTVDKIEAWLETFQPPTGDNGSVEKK